MELCFSFGTIRLTNVASTEGDHQLLRFTACRPGLGDHISVQCFHSALKASKLHHGVWDLTTPQRHQALVKAAQKTSPGCCQFIMFTELTKYCFQNLCKFFSPLKKPTLHQPIHAFSLQNFWKALSEGAGKARLCLHSNFDSLHWAQCNVGEELG